MDFFGWWFGNERCCLLSISVTNLSRLWFVLNNNLQKYLQKSNTNKRYPPWQRALIGVPSFSFFRNIPIPAYEVVPNNFPTVAAIFCRVVFAAGVDPVGVGAGLCITLRQYGQRRGDDDW